MSMRERAVFMLVSCEGMEIVCQKYKHLRPCNAGYNIRIVFSFVDHEGSEANLLSTLGTHEEVY